MLTIQQIEKDYHISRFRLMKSLSAGEISATRIGRSWVFDRSEVEHLQETLRRVTTADIWQIYKAMDMADISQADLARRLGVSPSYVNHILTGRAALSRVQYCKIMLSLGVNHV